MNVHGSCHCGRITYEAEADPQRVSLCNCTDCQALTGTAFRVSVPVPGETFKLLSGSPRAYVKTAQSGSRRRHYFCADCGSPVASTQDTDSPPAYSLRVGCLQERAVLPPVAQIWCRSALPWVTSVAGIPGKPTQ
jgi:hypothetical protein